MQVAHGVRRGRTQLVTQELSQALIGDQRFGGISLRGQRLHQQRVTALAVRSTAHELARRVLGLPRVSPSELGARLELERGHREVAQIPPSILDPGGRLAGEEGLGE